MKTLQHAVARFVREEEGVTAIEYGLIAGLIAVAIIISVQALGLKLASLFSYITGQLKVPYRAMSTLGIS
ncbi:Flp/Fap pilin component [Acidithiobacillus ferrooxidans ATCC 53993]|uniref:Flp family type IVb pilin n=1 Tax=Acidithiobacillus ferrooxidans TaxID=920 RepID=UPI00017F731C|nr:Flp family type IVb pilin [Acidithiobacillus ferrooxidans]ACH84533.1 Flp/Fap pilin component [Acidithiobacillus ferrooxidans ATCC 53993]